MRIDSLSLSDQIIIDNYGDNFKNYFYIESISVICLHYDYYIHYAGRIKLCLRFFKEQVYFYLSSWKTFKGIDE